MIDFKEILTRNKKDNDIKALYKRFDLYIEPIKQLIHHKKIDDLLYGLKLNYAFCMYEDRIIDGGADKLDSMLALYFQTEYSKWLLQFGSNILFEFEQSLLQFLEYTEKEISDNKLFDYNLENYSVKEAPIMFHIDLLENHTNQKMECDFIKTFYTFVLVVDDIEDLETDIKNGCKTLITQNLLLKGINPLGVKIKSRLYWKFVKNFLYEWLVNRLKLFEIYKDNEMYRIMKKYATNIVSKLN